MVDQFNNSPSTFVFLISSNAGGVGLNLTGEGQPGCTAATLEAITMPI